MHRETQRATGKERLSVTRHDFLRTAGVAAAAGIVGIGCDQKSDGTAVLLRNSGASTDREEMIRRLFKAPPALFRANTSGCSIQ